MSITQKVFSSRALNVNADTYVGQAGHLFYTQTIATGLAPVLKYSDGATPGGLPLSGSSLTFSSSTPPPNPHDGLLWWNTTDGRLYIYYEGTWVDASPDIQGAVTSIIAGSGISINTSTGAVTISATGGVGYVGSQGAIGYTGSVGSAPIGYVGSQGDPGYVGSQGDIGYTGSAGNDSTVPGYTGSQGDPGYVGSQGDIGYTGSQGDIGYVGSQGDIGYVGSQGDIGYTGSQGDIGYTGSQGDIGYVGSQGDIGYTGSQGDTGYTGSQGDIGYTGSQGDIGYVGSRGADSTVPGYVGSQGIQGPIGPNVPASVSSLGSVVIGANINVAPDGTISIPQNIATSSSVIFDNLTVNNITVNGTYTNAIPSTIEGYRIYLASSATDISQINAGGIQLGSTATGIRSLLWNHDDGNDYWYTDPTTGFQTEHLNASTSTLANLFVTGQARFGTTYASTTTFSNASARVDADVNSFAQFVIMNHSLDPNASSDLVATAAGGDDSNHYIDVGINGAGFSSSTWTVNGANDGYVYVNQGGLALGTDTPGMPLTTFIGGTTVSNIISVATETRITYSVDLVPNADAVYDLGKPGIRWRSAYVGTGSLFIQDISLGSNAELTVDNGVLFVNGISGLRLGNIQITPTGLTTYVGSQNIIIGSPGDTGYLQIYRGIQFYNGTLQTTAWNSTATVLWSQITGAPNVTGYTGSQGVAGYTGSIGYTGSTGTQGVIGYVGSIGYTGSTGTQGVIGYVGSIGYTGSQGVIGYVGSIGYTGSQGSIGYVGSIGYTGSASTVQGPSGYTGSIGYTGSVAGAYVSSITAGTGTAVSTSTGAVTIWAVPNTITSTGSTTASNYTIDLSGPSFVHWQPSANGSRTITLSNFTPGRKVEVFITPHTTNDVFTVSGVTASQCSNNKNTFTINGVGASAQTSFMLQIYCTTDTVGGIWIFGSSSV